MSDEVLSRIRNLLQSGNIVYQVVEHAATYSSAESAVARKQDLSLGAKALLLRVDDEFALFVVRANRRISSSTVKKQLRARRLRFATADELRQLTSLVPGAVPPFGEPVLPFKLFADLSLVNEGSQIAFNAGSLTHSISMSVADWKRIANPAWLDFSEPSCDEQ